MLIGALRFPPGFVAILLPDGRFFGLSSRLQPRNVFTSVPWSMFGVCMVHSVAADDGGGSSTALSGWRQQVARGNGKS